MKAVVPGGEGGGRSVGDDGAKVCNRALPDTNKRVTRQPQVAPALTDGDIEVNSPVQPVAETAPSLFEGTFSSVREPRYLVERFDMDTRLCHTTALVLSELTTNAMLHAGGSFTLRLWYTHDWARIEVQDASARLPVFPRGVPAARNVSGRGLYMVEVLSNLWGAELRDRGKVVWAEVGQRPLGYVDLRHNRQ
jgi:hypothetical protein